MIALLPKRNLLQQEVLLQADASAGFPSPEASLGAPSDESYTYNILLVGETGSGKTTLLNMLVNFFRGGPEARTKLPSKQDLRVAVPTAYLKATEPEGVQQIERDVRDSKLLHCCCLLTPGCFNISRQCRQAIW